MKLSDVRKQLHTLQVENLTGAQIKSAAGEMFLSLDALVSQHDAQDIVKTYKAVKTPTYGQPIPGTFRIIEKVGEGGAVSLLGPTVLSSNKAFTITALSGTAIGGAVTVNFGYFDGSTFCKFAALTISDGDTNTVDLSTTSMQFDSNVYPAILVTSGTASNLTVTMAYAETVQ